MIRAAIITTLALATARGELAASFKAGEAADARLDRLPALLVKPGEPSTPFLAPGPFEVVWTGKLVLPERQRLAFSFEGSGTASLSIDGKPLLEESGTLGTKASDSTRLNPGEHDIAITFKSQPDGSGRFRLFWEERAFPKQSVPPTVFKTEATEPVTLGELQRQGRQLFSANHCAKCHVPANGLGATPMPETSEFGPLLAGEGERVTGEWLARWIAAPHQLRPATRMPALVDASKEEGRQQAADIAAFIASQKLGGEPGKPVDPQLAQKGGETFHTLGCVACHTLPSQTEPDRDHHRLPLNNVASKFQPGALAAFLKKPDAFHPSSSMPDFRLSEDEAASLAAFLTTASTGKETQLPATLPAGDLGRGEALVKSLHCGSCHPGLPMAEKTTAPAMEAIFGKDWTAAGCVAPPAKRGKAPLLNLDDNERLALVAFSKTGSSPLTRDTPAEYVRRSITAQRCTACHAIDGKASLLDEVHTTSRSLVADLKHLDERVAQDRPQFTYLGEMLHASYIESMLQGTAEPRPRPWLLMRMPAFHSRAAAFAEGFARLHGIEPGKPGEVAVDPTVAEAGKKLVSAEGLGCVTCHAIGEAKSTAAFEVEGINLALLKSRVRDEYFHRWMDNPPAVTPGTKMPRYADGNQSQRTDILEGDAKKQYDAVWQYLHQK
ncbi:MAG: c-type cytochrome [Luteolibacter sp.]